MFYHGIIGPCIIFCLLLNNASPVNPLEEQVGSKDIRPCDTVECQETGREKDHECTVMKDGDCNIKPSVLERCASDDEAGSCILSDFNEKNEDESELHMLEEEENNLPQEESEDEEGLNNNQAQENTEGCPEIKAKNDEANSVIDETGDTSCKKDPHTPDVIEKEDVEDGGCVKEETQRQENPEQDTGTEDVDHDMENENVPLREILLKLKPEGLTDDEDEQSSDYSSTEASISDVEVEEEALVSSGSAEKQDQDDGNMTNTKNNGDASNSSNSSSGSSNKKAVCLEVNVTEAILDVEIINATTLMRLLQVDPNVTGRTTACPCHLIYFFSPYCPFSVVGSPYVNALARSLPNIPVYGMDSIEHHSVNARYGVMGTPTLLLFHNGNGVGRYNASEYSVSQLMSFVRHYTDQEITNINVTSQDFRAKLPSQVGEARPYALWAAWVFLLSCASWLFLTSELCARVTEAVLNNWREAEAQNDHQD
ncbi:hypothetical protein Pmani_017357 [Petrolisthes manimaculis]|uniref:Thioredoxin domain-containing protein n=1 Tax=Petrolisthes manimaculis TaxID=1843537 RepID=A0AAE1PMT5_9EUCA|nr:hypothetical protein Pmani_017357 [Petrolisthes manimaculis]